MKRIVADPPRCLACRTCEFACALAHADSDDLVQAITVQGAKSRIYVESVGDLAVPLQCQHCEGSPCLTVCPKEALTKSSDSDPVLVDEKKCIGCSFCVEACPFGMIVLDDGPAAEGSKNGKVVIKCDLCLDRQAQGLEPACVSACPTCALALEEVDGNA